jgi:predicted nucleic acid-binding Zn ribbon protein
MEALGVQEPCPRCGEPLPPRKAGQRRVWCSDRCRVLAHKSRHRDPNAKPMTYDEVLEDLIRAESGWVLPG